MRSKPLDIAIIGAGVSGLSLAFYLEQFSKKNGLKLPKSAIFEAAESVGGKLQTAIEESFILDLGPDSIATRKAEVYDLICDLGLQSEMIAPREKKFSILKSGRLREIELGLLSTFPRNIKAVLSTEIISIFGKLRAGLGLIASYLTADKFFYRADNQSLAQFFKLKWGLEMYNNLLAPLFTGLYGSDLENISYKVFKQDQASKSGRQLPPYISLRGGIRSLISALEAKLDATQIHCNSPVTSISRTEDYWQISIADSVIKAKVLVLAVPPNKASKLLQTVDPKLSQILGDFQSSDAAILSLGYKNVDLSQTLLEKAGSGVIVPECESESIRGITLSSKKWTNRAEEKDLLVRVFGRTGVFEKLGLEHSCALAAKELERILNLKATPVLSKLQLWPQGSVQCGLDHFNRLDQLQQFSNRLGSIYFHGSGFGGIGIADCIQSSKVLAEKLPDLYIAEESHENSDSRLETFPKNELAFS
jgi:oxygen-dependent protoporphyrinogen oxidase